MLPMGGSYRELVSRTHDDACPGALQVHHAADGALARIRLPGGILTPGQLQMLADAASQYAAGTLELTARGNIQLRGITDTEAIADVVAEGGLLPSLTHERVRNIVASPLSGRRGGLVDVRPWVTDLDHAIQSDPDLAGLPGRFLFSIDDGSGDVTGLCADLGVHLLSDKAALLLSGADTGIRLSHAEVVPALTEVARRFESLRGNAWRITELDDVAELISGLPVVGSPITLSGADRPPVGWIAQDDGRIALGAAVPLGVLTARQAEFVAAIDAPVVITPWRSLLVCDLDDGVADTSLRVLAPMGLVFDANSPWLDVSACVGSPGCARSRADVRALATLAVESHEVTGSVTGRVHYVGCERGCGSPPTGSVLVADTRS